MWVITVIPKPPVFHRNEVVCHGIPSTKTVLKDGDIINIDVAVIKDGFYGDTSRMYYVGQVKPEAKKLVDTTYEAMHAGIHAVKPGATLGISAMPFKSVAHREGYSIVREDCGHGIGKGLSRTTKCTALWSAWTRFGA